MLETDLNPPQKILAWTLMRQFQAKYEKYNLTS